MPGCTKYHKCIFVQDYSKNHFDSFEERPGYFHEFNLELDDKKQNISKWQRPGQNSTKMDHTGHSYDLCSFGDKGTPINLETSSRPLEDFSDADFKVSYKNINPATNTKYKESGQQW